MHERDEVLPGRHSGTGAAVPATASGPDRAPRHGPPRKRWCRTSLPGSLFHEDRDHEELAPLVNPRRHFRD